MEILSFQLQQQVIDFDSGTERQLASGRVCLDCRLGQTPLLSHLTGLLSPAMARMQFLFRGMIPILLLASMSLSSRTTVQAQGGNEYQVKAAFILNFARFVEWPGDGYGNGGTLVVGIVGDDPFGSSLDQLNGNTVNGRRIEIRRLRVGDNLKACQVLFIGSSERNRLGKILDSVRGGSVLTIGELPQFNQAGGIIKFLTQDNKVRFEINAGAAAQARLRISSKLLALSKGGRN